MDNLPPNKPRTNKEWIAHWLTRIKRAVEVRQPSEKDWAENRDMCNAVGYRGHGAEDTGSAYARIYKNIFLSTLNIMVPNLYSKNPSFTALPKREIDHRSYKASEMFVNYATGVTGLKQHAKDAIRDGLMATCSYLKVGYIIEPVKVKVKIGDDGKVEAIDESVPQPMSTLKIEEALGGVGTRPFTRRVSPWNFVRSRGSTSIKNAAWVAERIYMRLEEVKSDPFLKNTSGLKPNALPFSIENIRGGTDLVGPARDNRTVAEGQALSDPDDELVELWEIWDRVNDKMMVITEGHDQFLRDGPWPYDLAGRFPYAELQFIRIADIPYPIPYLSMFKDLAKEVNIISSYELEHVKRATPRIGYNKAMVDEEDIEAYQKGDPIPMVGCKGSPAEVFYTIGGAEMSESLKWTHGKVEDDINLMSSMPDFMRGGGDEDTKLATVAKLKAQGSNVRLEEMVDVVSDWMIEWAELIHMLGKQFCDTEMEIRITGSATMKMAKVGKRDLDNHCDFQLVTGSFQPINRDVQRDELMKLFNLVASFIQPGSLNVNGQKLLMMIGNLWPLPGMDKIVGDDQPIPPADPAEENWLMQNEGNPEVSPRENFQQHLQVHQAFLQELMADPQGNAEIIAKVQDHMDATMQAEQAMLMQQMVQQAGEQKAMGAIQGLPEGQPGAPGAGPHPPQGRPAPQRTQGAGGPAPHGPIRPRQFNQAPSSQAGIQSRQGRSPGGHQ